MKLLSESCTLYCGIPQRIEITNPDENSLTLISHISKFTWLIITKMTISSGKIRKSFVEALEKDYSWLDCLQELIIELEDPIDFHPIDSFIGLINNNSLSMTKKIIKCTQNYHVLDLLGKEKLLQDMENYVFTLTFPLTEDIKKRINKIRIRIISLKGNRKIIIKFK